MLNVNWIGPCGDSEVTDQLPAAETAGLSAPGLPPRPPKRPPGPACVGAGGLTSYDLPSTKTCLTCVRRSKRSPLVTTMLAILPFSMLPNCSDTPKISAG